MLCARHNLAIPLHRDAPIAKAELFDQTPHSCSRGHLACVAIYYDFEQFTHLCWPPQASTAKRVCETVTTTTEVSWFVFMM